MPPKRRRRFQGLYYHSSPPKVMPMNDQSPNQNGRRRREVDDFSIKLSTIRIWMHEKDIGKLTRILWAGQGNRLRQQASTNPRVKRFLAAVPHVMNNIKDVHQAVIDNNLETLQASLEPPVPPALITGKDANGLNIIHKAAGLGHTKILEYLISAWPEGINEPDITGKTPLHWAASAKNNMRCYTLLTQAGCDEEAVDYKSKTPSYYRHKPHEIERAFLVYVPDAPRVSPDVTTDWDALREDTSTDSSKKFDIKPALTNGINGTNEDIIENTSEVDLNDGNVSVNGEDEASKNEEIIPNDEEDVVENVNEPMPDANDAEENAENLENAEADTEENDKPEEEESRIQEIISSGDMEQLAQIVLNGDGSKLLDMQSKETDIQAFLNNVPNYMSKIRRVHEAARDGSLLSLQQALDRRKFAIAKDEISPNGATPLHVAILFGHSDIVRYLAARFPETTTVTDNDGRTALHYAAVIKDNGYFYNMLTQLGANPKAKDKLGHTPEFYLDTDNSSEVLTYRQLLGNFGAEDLEAELLSDQGEAESHSFQSNPIFKTEQGKYLATTLADPLIEALTEIANKRPDDPISYLTTYLQTYMRSRNPKTTGASSSKTSSTALIHSNASGGGRSMNGNVKNANLTSPSTDEIENDEGDEAVTPQSDDRDEHGQSVLHFACARSHRRGGLINLIEESNIDVTYRDELYRTARDVSLQANQPANAREIDRYMMSLAVVGDLRPFEHFAISGYDHIIDISDDSDKNIVEVVTERGYEEFVEFLRKLRPLEESREELHQMIRDNNVSRVKEIASSNDGKWLLQAKNYYGRTALHIAVLKESEEIVEHFVDLFPDAIKIGDNLERTPLHYAMGTNAIESLSRILINKGAKRTAKDLKGRQPSYYFMNKADILRLQEEEDENR